MGRAVGMMSMSEVDGRKGRRHEPTGLNMVEQAHAALRTPWQQPLTLSLPIPLTLPVPHFSDCGKMSLPNRSGQYWSNRPFFVFDIRALWRSVLSAREPECQKLKNGVLDYYGAGCFEV